MAKKVTIEDRMRKWAEESAAAAQSAATEAKRATALLDTAAESYRKCLNETRGMVELLSARIDTLRDDHDDTRKMVLALAVRLNKIDPPPPVVMFCPVCRDVELERGAECNGVVNLTCPKCGLRLTATQPDKVE